MVCRFMRFPGGCYVEGGDWLKDRFQWKASLGTAVNRPGHFNEIWGYWSSDGLYDTSHPPLCLQWMLAGFMVILLKVMLSGLLITEPLSLLSAAAGMLWA